MSYEYRLSDKITAATSVNMGFLSYADYGTWHPVMLLEEKMDVGIRYYYNLEKRAGKQLNTDYNSGNYFGIVALSAPFVLVSEVANSNFISLDRGYPVVLLSPVWGLQRSYNRWLINVTAGAGWQINYAHKNTLGILAKFTVGYALNK